MLKDYLTNKKNDYKARSLQNKIENCVCCNARPFLVFSNDSQKYELRHYCDSSSLKVDYSVQRLLEGSNPEQLIDKWNAENKERKERLNI